jgi:DNA repair exonuclease SbcCD ATPase subunit
MDSPPLDKRLAWLDDQRVKDAERVGKLGDRMARLEQTLSRQDKLLQELSGEMARLSALSTRMAQLDDTLAQHRQEVARLLKTAEEGRTEKERQVQQLARSDQKEVAKAMAELRKDLDRLGDVRESLSARREEESRVSRALDASEKRLDSLLRQDEARTRTLEALAEARKQDDRRLQEMQTFAADFQVKQETLHGALDALEDRARRIEVRLGELSASEAERLELQQLWVEQQGRRMVDFERSGKEWGPRFASIETRAGEVEARIREYEETHRKSRQLQQDVEAALERLERRIGEVGELQRLAEERHKQEWASFQSEDHRRWTTHKVTADEQWREHGRAHDRLAKDAAPLQEALRKVEQAVAGVQEAERRHLAEMLAAVRQWVNDLQEPPVPKR